MPTDPPSQPSFSPGRRWKIGFDVAVRTALVLAVVVMVNFLAARPRLFGRFYLSSQTRIQLSSQTLGILKSLTNDVAVTLYYDTKDPDNFYPDIVALLNEYRLLNPRLSIRTVDYVRDAGEAEKVKEQYKLNLQTDKNLVIFDCNGRIKITPGDGLTQYTLKQIPNEKEREFQRKPVAFNGEMAFTTMLLALENPKPLMAYFLQGHGEPSLADSGDYGYLKFGSLLAQNYIALTNLQLLGDSAVPMDCNLLIIAAPARRHCPNSNCKRLTNTSRKADGCLMLFNYASIKQSDRSRTHFAALGRQRPSQCGAGS